MILMIDNYDSFTYNLVQYLGELGADLEVYRNDRITIAEIEKVRANGGKVWALGATVARSLESMAGGLLEKQSDGSYTGETKLFIYPPYEFQIVDCL